MTYKERVAKARERWAKRGGAPPIPPPDLPDPCADENAEIDRLVRERDEAIAERDALREAANTALHCYDFWNPPPEGLEPEPAADLRRAMEGLRALAAALAKLNKGNEDN